MAANVYLKDTGIERHRNLYNDTGADVSQYDFEVVGPYAAVADEDVASTATGGFDISEDVTVRTDELKAAENTFGTRYAAVYWDAATLKFSDTSTVGYYLVGYVTADGTKDSAGYIEFAKLMYAELVSS